MPYFLDPMSQNYRSIILNLNIKFVFTFKKQFNSQGKFITEDLAAQTYKEFLQLYNKPIQNCFIACMTNFNYQKVTA